MSADADEKRAIAWIKGRLGSLDERCARLEKYSHAPVMRLLRDDFAIAAMQAWLSRAAFNNEAEQMMHAAGVREAEDKERFIARLAYSMADHMLAAREEKEGGGK